MFMKKIECIQINGEEVEKKYTVKPLVAKVLSYCAYSDEQIEDLLTETIHLQTSEAKCILDAAKRIMLAKEKKEKVFIAGDYDADGICATTIMKMTLNHLQIKNGYYIPDRLKDHYGLSSEIVKKAFGKGYRLIITVDNGVSCFEAIAEAKRLGMDVIVTDHHLIGEDCGADILVHPSLMEERFAYLCGAGVAYELSRLLIGDRDDLCALASVASIGDVMPLWKETRAIVKKGLQILNTSHKPLSLYSLAPEREKHITADTIGFYIAPKLNSFGRLAELANANNAPKYLLLTKKEEIEHVIFDINHLNDVRKHLAEKQFKQMKDKVEEEAFIIQYDESFHEGINGLAAAKLMREFGRPALVLSKNGDMLKGSARTIEGLHLKDFLLSFPYVSGGGHELAAGISLKAEDFEKFYHDVQEKMQKEYPNGIQKIDSAIILEPEDISLEAIMELSRLEPYPKEIKDVYFAIKNMNSIVQDYEKVRKYRIPIAEGYLEAIIFKNSALYKSGRFDELKENDYFIGHLTINRFNGTVSAQMMIENIKGGSEA